MSYYTPKELADSLRTVRKNTIQIAQDIPEEKYSFAPAPGTRTVAQLLAHIAVAPGFQRQVHAVERRSTLEGMDFGSVVGKAIAEEQRPRTKAEILDLLQKDGNAWADWVEAQSEGFLSERVAMPAGMTPASKSRFEMVLSTKEHEMHHRGQLMLIERLLGIVPHLTRQMQERMAAMQAGQAAR
jgi:uncharacterized damage-inducible protein DinB